MEFNMTLEELETLRWALSELASNRHGKARWIRRFHPQVEGVLSRVEMMIRQATRQRSTNHNIFESLMAEQHAQAAERRAAEHRSATVSPSR